jgi:hypothetical protein
MARRMNKMGHDNAGRELWLVEAARYAQKLPIR